MRLTKILHKIKNKMKYLLFSDIQGNYPKLQTWVNSIIRNPKDNSDSYIPVCLGDIIQHGSDFNDNRCIEVIRSLNGITVKGNHEEKILKNKDEYLEKIYSINLNFIAKLPKRLILDKKYLFKHEAFSPLNGRIFSQKDAKLEFRYLKDNYPDINISFVGHSHKPFLFEYNPKCIQKIVEKNNLFQRTIFLNEKKKYLINPGGIGLYYNLPLTYLLFDSQKNSVQFKLFK